MNYPKRVLSVLTLSGVLVSQTSFGWGEYGHEQINAAAATLLQDTSFGTCVDQNKKLLTRLAITPDLDWKAETKRDELGEELNHKRHQIEFWEKKAHFWGGDAFVVEPAENFASFAKLPSGAFADVVGEYQDLLATNHEFAMTLNGHPETVLKNESKGTAKEVAIIGTAPWRIQQLFDESVEALKESATAKPQKKKELWKTALHYLGAMGHYVGDMSQPFHTTIIFNGQLHGADGIHALIDTEVFKTFTRSRRDNDTHLFTSFDKTESEVLRYAAKQGEIRGELASDKIVEEIFTMAGEGYAYVNPIMTAFAASREELQPVPEEEVTPAHPEAASSHGHSHEKIKAATIQDFMERTIEGPDGEKRKVVDLLNERLGRAAGVLSRLWLSALEESGVKAQDCPTVAFDDKFILEKYPMPTYLPKFPANPH